MISGIKQMIARCIEQMRGGACATCDNRAFCPAGQWQHRFGMLAKEASPPSPLLGFLRDIAGAIAAPAAEAPPRFRGEVEAALERLISSGDVGVDRIASELGVSRQTLYRRLKAEGATFEELLDSKRRELAIRYLGRDRISVKAAAYRLGFSDPAAFSRAFKRWTGISPSHFREAPSG